MGRKSKKSTKKCYKILDVARDASKSTIKKAYFHLSKIHHPDKQEDQQNQASMDKATAKFQEIQKAYEEAIKSCERHDKSSVGNRDEGEEEDYDYDQHMYKRYRKQQQSDRSSGFSDWFDKDGEETESPQEDVVHEQQQQSDLSSGYSDWFDINVEETETALAVVVHHGEQIDEDEEIERRAQEKVEEHFAYEEMGEAKMNARHHGKLKSGQVSGLCGNLKQSIQQFRLKQKYKDHEHELVAGCRSCNKWFRGMEGYLSHVRSDKHTKKSAMPRFARQCHGTLKVTYDTLSSRQRRDPTRWKELSLEVQQQIEFTVSEVRGADSTISENTHEKKSEELCDYVDNHSCAMDPDLVIKCSATAFYCGAPQFNSVADYYKYHRNNVKEE